MCMQIGCSKTNYGVRKTKTSEHKMIQSADLQSKWSKHETSQNKHQEKLQQGKAQAQVVAPEKGEQGHHGQALAKAP